ncbi:GNAT family N-acetyltransferase [Cellulosimicrobium protaetiae]|uniref:GNAT family N-acetyltransferase n=1 Tax=Cellulosimicrobium protaetiae TaxID=2587808 RepID=A0A6M5UCF7_9MICO|nr:GNAT family N-acetyltransferase [Cellulosimicrobium protaetiae]QJW34843.1 GNAT family N-acetyltransferase [Cellulosimicrobium protaetiae]
MTATSTQPDATGVDDAVLENPSWSALSGAHAHLAEGDDLARRYPADVSPITGVRSWDEPGVWDAVAALVGPGGRFSGPPVGVDLPEGWTLEARVDGVQLVETERLATRPDPDAVVLGAADVPEMLALVERSRPGPFEARTYLLGRYVGFRDDAGRLVAMAGERLHPAGWTEISAVTTDVAHRGRGLASRLVRDVAFHVQERGDRAFLHAAAENVSAIGVYERLGFALRRRTSFGSLLAPR